MASSGLGQYLNPWLLMLCPGTLMDSLLLSTLDLLKSIVDSEKGIIPYPKLHLKKVKLVEVQGVPLLAKPDEGSSVGWLHPPDMGLEADTRDIKAFWHTLADRTVLGYQGI